MNQDKVSVRPTAVTADLENGYSNLIFNENRFDAPSGQYIMRGGIAFPMLMDDNSLKGYAVMCGLNVSTGIVYVFEEVSFVSMNHIIEDGQILFHGFADNIPEWWKAYFANYFFVNQDYDTKRKYSIELIRSHLAKPSPAFLVVNWKNDDQPLQSIYEKDTIGKLIYSSEGDLFQEMKEFQSDRSQVLPALHALKCAITGIEKYRIANIR